MKVRFIGEHERVNSFGRFVPNKVYDVSDEVGKQLLTAPGLFVRADGKPEKATDAKNQIVEVADDGDPPVYNNYTINELRSMVRERGLTTRRNARKAEYIELLVTDDVEKEAAVESDNDVGNEDGDD